MTKKKPTDNHNVMLIDACKSFNELNIETILKDFNFKIPASILAEQLNEAITYFESAKQFDNIKPRLSKQKKYLKKLGSVSEQLAELLANMGSEISLRLIRAKPDKGKQPEAFDLLERLETDLKDLYWRSIVAKKEISTDKGSRPKDRALQLFVTQLSSLFKEGTGLPATCGWDDIELTYTGSFYNFTLEIIEIAKIKTNIQDIGKFIQRTLNEQTHAPGEGKTICAKPTAVAGDFQKSITNSKNLSTGVLSSEWPSAMGFSPQKAFNGDDRSTMVVESVEDASKTETDETHTETSDTPK